MTLRRAWYAAPGRQHRLRRPVISVGNLAMGGRGKTPLVAHVAQLLVAAGERPAVLSRGYARRSAEPGVVVVSDGAHLLADVDRSGDEPLMVARMVPGAVVAVSDERVLAGVLAERALGASVHLLDDGFQHLAIARDTDIVIVTPEDLRGRAAPFGRLREPIAALAAADAVVIDAAGGCVDRAASIGAADLPMAVRKRNTPVFALNRRLGGPVPLEPDRPWPPGKGPVVAVAGIARPDRFRHALVNAGWTVSQMMTFRDHHAYSLQDVLRMAAAAHEAGASAVVTTAKDAVRLMAFRPLPVPMAAVPLDVSIEPADAFETWLFGRLEEARS
jgi:tetraacyldisaccharide 4'-kinase